MGMSRSATMGFGNQIPLPCSYSTCMPCIYTEEVWALLAILTKYTSQDGYPSQDKCDTPRLPVNSSHQV